MTISIDTNVLFAMVQEDDLRHDSAAKFFSSVSPRSDVVLSELALIELYVLLRNPAAVEHPLSAEQAVAICNGLRSHPRWQVVGLPAEIRSFHDAVWQRLAVPNFARRRAYDVRLALSLVGQGVDEFATANLRHFQDVGFRRVWNPLAEG